LPTDLASFLRRRLFLVRVFAERSTLRCEYDVVTHLNFTTAGKEASARLHATFELRNTFRNDGSQGSQEESPRLERHESVVVQIKGGRLGGIRSWKTERQAHVDRAALGPWTVQAKDAGSFGNVDLE
jgi:hypothetical protein